MLDTLAEVAAAGYCIDEWADWQQGNCDVYARALIQLNPTLRFGVLDGGSHCFAHDDEYAYDSAGRHSLPYRGIHEGDFTDDDVELDADPDDYGYGTYTDEPGLNTVKALYHIQRHGILTGRYEAKKA